MCRRSSVPVGAPCSQPTAVLGSARRISGAASTAALPRQSSVSTRARARCDGRVEEPRPARRLPGLRHGVAVWMAPSAKPVILPAFTPFPTRAPMRPNVSVSPTPGMAAGLSLNQLARPLGRYAESSALSTSPSCLASRLGPGWRGALLVGTHVLRRHDLDSRTAKDGTQERLAPRNGAASCTRSRPLRWRTSNTATNRCFLPSRTAAIEAVLPGAIDCTKPNSSTGSFPGRRRGPRRRGSR